MTNNLKHRYLYRIFSRNLDFGVFDSPNNSFIGIRHKCGEVFLDREYKDIGCVRVLEEIEKMPDSIDLTQGYFSYVLIKRWSDRPNDFGPLWIENKDLLDYLDKGKTKCGM
jgi:hypothetical protein